jgi:hypothetical protein
MPFLWGTTAELIAPNVVRVKLKDIGRAARPGDWASLSSGNEPGGLCHGITIENCNGGMTLRDVTLHCAPGMGIVEAGGAGGSTLENVRIVPGPPPPGGWAPRLLTTSWDGVLHSNVGRGPRVERCVIEDCGDDPECEGVSRGPERVRQFRRVSLEFCFWQTETKSLAATISGSGAHNGIRRHEWRSG